jgi:hypothetical protein
VSHPTRTDLQNKMMWPLLAEFEKQGATIKGQTFRDHQWKSVFLEALGHEQEFLPSLDGSRWFAAGLRSSTLGKKEFSDLIEMILAEAAHRGVIIQRPKELDAAETEGASDQPAADPPSVREPSGPVKPQHMTAGQAATLTEAEAVEYAEQWAEYYRTLPTDQEDAFCAQYEHIGPIFREQFPRAYRLMQAAVFTEKKDAA